MKIISRKALSLLLTLAMVFGMVPFSSVTAFAADSGVKTMYYKNNQFYKDSNCTTPVEDRAAYTALEVKSGVISIDYDTFYGCTALTSVTIPSSVTSIGYSTFSGFQNLKDVTVMGAASILDYAFSDCPALTSVTMPNVTSIANCAFSNCHTLASVTIPSVTSIVGSAFFGCPALTSVTMPNVISIGEGAFSDCTSLTSVTMPNVTSIGSYAFSGCTALPGVTVPNVTSVGDDAFSGSALTSITLPNATSLGKEAFKSCSSLTSVTMTSLTTVQYDAFDSCSSLTSITMPNVTFIGDHAFYNCTALTSVTMPNVTTVDGSAFALCEGLTDFTMPNLTSVGSGAFYCCTKLTDAIMPNVASIGDGAFEYCNDLTGVTIPGTASIGGKVFSDCSRLHNLYVVGEAAPAGMPEIANTFLFTRYQTDGQSYYKLTGYTCTGTGMQIPTDFSGIQIQPSINKNDIKITDKIAYCNGTGLYTNEGCTIPVDSSSKSLLTKIVFSPGITAIGDSMFYGCTDLATVTIPASVISIGDAAFNECRNLKDVTILGAASIGERVFEMCGALTSITMPNVTSIDRSAFYHCTALTGVTIPNVTSIGEEAFVGCSSLTSVIIPNVTSIGYYAFAGCPALTAVAFKGKADIEIGAFWTSEFSGAVTFAVPAETKAYYESLLNSDVMGPIKATVIAGELVTAFDALPSGTATQNVANGTAQAALILPSDLSATADGLKETIHNVTWAPATAYEPATAGTYIFTAVLPSNYIPVGGVALPTITVHVAAAESHHSDSSASPEAAAPRVEITTANTASSTVTTVTAVPDSAPTVSGSQSNVSVTIPADVSSTITSATPKKPVEVKITVPTASLVEQLSSSAVQTVDLTVKVPAAVANNTNTSATVSIKAEQTVLQAAKDAKKDVTLSVINSETDSEAYSWTFKGSDLAASTTEVKSVDLALSVKPTTAVPSVNKATQSNKGLVLSFANNGVLPSTATVKINVAGQGYKPGQTVYFYYYNPTTKALEQVGNSAAYTVDENGFVSIKITHCSDYVLLPKAARSLTLDTKTYTVAPKMSYEIGAKLTGANGMTVKVYSSGTGAAAVAKLKNGNYKVTGLKPGVTYIMFDVYDEKNKLISKSHASVRLNVVNHAKPSGDSTRQVAVF